MSNHLEVTAERVWIVIAANVWQLCAWGSFFWFMYEKVPIQKEIFSDFEFETPLALDVTIDLSDAVVIYPHWAIGFLIVLLVVNSLGLLRNETSAFGRMLWILASTAVPFFALILLMFVTCEAFQWFAIQSAFRSALMQ